MCDVSHSEAIQLVVVRGRWRSMTFLLGRCKQPFYCHVTGTVPKKTFT